LVFIYGIPLKIVCPLKNRVNQKTRGLSPLVFPLSNLNLNFEKKETLKVMPIPSRVKSRHNWKVVGSPKAFSSCARVFSMVHGVLLIIRFQVSIKSSSPPSNRIAIQDIKPQKCGVRPPKEIHWYI
jgi:hypothetical protein